MILNVIDSKEISNSNDLRIFSDLHVALQMCGKQPSNSLVY